MRHLIKGLVSVIVPVYNTKPEYLEECFESVRNQSYEKRELIIVDDGSENKAVVDKCRSYAKENEDWCRLITQANSGVSVARSVGLMEADGEKVMFLDSDDTLEPQAIGRLMELMIKHEADAAIGEDYVRESFPKITEYVGRNILSELLDNKEASFGWALWGKLFDTDLMRYYYRPHSDIYYGEDLLANAEYFSNATKVVVVNEKIYNYRKDNADSAMNQSITPKKLTLIRMWEQMEKIYKAYGLEKDVLKIRANYYDSLLSGYFECQYHHYDNYKLISSQIKQEITDNMKDIRDNPYVKDKKKYFLAMNMFWIYKLNRYLKGKKQG